MRLYIYMALFLFSCVKPQPVESLELDIPSQNSSLDAKIDYYDKYKIINKNTKSVYISNKNGADIAYSYIESAMLSNGRKIHTPQTLADALPETDVERHYSNGVAIAEETKKTRRASRVILVVSIATMPLVVPTFIGFVVINSLNRKKIEVQKKALREFDLVYLTYNKTLREQLGLCLDPTIVTVDGEALVACPDTDLRP